MDSLFMLFHLSLVALAFAFWKASWVAKQDAGSEVMTKIAGRIQDGAMAFLRAEYKVLAGFVVIVAILLGVANASGAEGSNQDPLIALSFVVGAFASLGWVGMKSLQMNFVQLQQLQTEVWLSPRRSLQWRCCYGDECRRFGTLRFGLVVYY